MTPAMYSVPLAHRKTENLHIVFWLMKDIGWCMGWKVLGVTMIVPTLGAAIWICWRARSIATDFAHNLAIVFWISANAWWMLTEFFALDETPLLFGISGRYCSMIFFLMGASILARHYAGRMFAARSVVGQV